MRHKLLFIISLLTVIPTRVCGQNDDEYWVEKEFQFARSMQNDGMYKYVTGKGYEDLYGPRKKIDMSQIERTIREKQQEQERIEQERQLRLQQAQQKSQQQIQQNKAHQQQSSGIQFVVDPSRTQPKRTSSAAAAQKQKKAQDEASHQAWLERRRQENEAKRQQAIEKMKREQEARERRNREIEADERGKSWKEYQHHAAQVDLRVNEGRDFMYNYHVQGTEIQESHYVPSPTSYEPVTVTPKGGYSTKNVITLNGDEKVTTQMEEWQYSADFERTSPIPPCKDTIEVVPIGNGCGPAEGKYFQVAAKIGLYLDALKQVHIYRFNKDLMEEVDRLEKVCSFVHDPGYVKAKTPQEKEEADEALSKAGGQIMAFFTKKFGGWAWHDAQEDARISRVTAEEHPEIKFDPNTQMLKRYRKCR